MMNTSTMVSEFLLGDIYVHVHCVQWDGINNAQVFEPNFQSIVWEQS